MITAKEPHYYIAPDSIDIQAASYAGVHKFKVNLRDDASVLVYYPKVSALGYRSDGSYLAFHLKGAGNRYLRSLSSTTYHLYVCFPKDFKEFDDTAYLSFQTERIPITPTSSNVPPSQKAREMMDTHYYIYIGTFFADDGFDLDTGALGTIAQQNAWQEKLEDVPTRIEVTYLIAGSTIDNGETPHLDWNTSLTLNARLLREWATDVTDRVDHWTIVRDSGDAIADAAWNALATFTGSINLSFTDTRNDLGVVGAETKFTLTAYTEDNSVLATRTVVITHTDLQTWIVEYDAPIGAINVDPAGNVKGGLWTEETRDGVTYRKYLLHTAISVRRGNTPLIIAPNNQPPGTGQYQIYPSASDCTLVVYNSTIYITAIKNIKDGVAGTPDDLWKDEDYENMRSMKDATVEFVVNCEGLASITKRFSISINHDATPYVAVDMAPATAEVTFDEQWRNGSYSANNSSFIGLPIDISLLARYNEERVKITAVVPTLNGDQLSPEDYTLSYYNADSSDGDSSDSSDDSSDEDPLTGSIDGISIRALPKPDTGGTLLNHRVLSLALTATYAGVSYERTMRVPLTERYKTVTSTNVRHYLLTANDDWGQAGVPPYDYSGWTTTPETTEVSAEYPYLWIWDETVFSNGKTANATPILMGNWAESAVTYYINVTPSTVPTDAGGTIKQSAQNIVIVPYKRLGTLATERIKTTGYMLIVTAYDAAGQQVSQTSSTSTASEIGFSLTWTPVAGAVRAVVQFVENSEARTELCASVTIPYVADGAPGSSPWYADIDNEMDSIACDYEGHPASAQTVRTTVSMWHGSDRLTSTIRVFDDSTPTHEYTNGTAHDGITVTWSDGQSGTGLVTVAFASGNTVTINGKKRFRIRQTSGTEHRDVYFTVNGVRPGANGQPATIYNLLPSTNQIPAQRTDSGGYSPATYTLTCGYTKNVGGVMTAVDDATGKIDNTYYIFFRRRLRRSQEWEDEYFYRYDFYKSSMLIAFSLTTFDAVEFIICNDVIFTKFPSSSIGSHTVIDKETVPVVADGMKGDDAEIYYMDINPSSLALAPGGDTFTDGQTTKAINVTVYKRIGSNPPTVVGQNDTETLVTINYGDGRQPETEPKYTNSFTVTVSTAMSSVTMVLSKRGGSPVLETRTIAIQAAGKRGVSPRQREWALDLTWHTGSMRDTWKDFCVIKDAAGVVHTFECIKEHISDTNNCPLNVDGSINYNVVDDGSSDSDSSDDDDYLWREPTEQFDFVSTNILLSKYLLAESGAFDGLRVNNLRVDKDSRVGGFTFNEPYTLLPKDVVKCVNPYNYGMLDAILWHESWNMDGSTPDIEDVPAESKQQHAAHQLQDVRFYESLNVMFPDCGSSIVVTNDCLAGRNEAKGSPLYYLYINLPFYYPITMYERDGNPDPAVTFYMNDVNRIIRNPSPFISYGYSPAPNSATRTLLRQIKNSEKICNNFLGTRFTVRNELKTNNCELIIYGVRGITNTLEIGPSLVYDGDQVSDHIEYDPWGRTTTWWRFYVEGQGVKIPYLSPYYARKTIDTYRYFQDSQNYYDFEKPGHPYPLFGDQEVQSPNSNVPLKLLNCFEVVYNNVGSAYSRNHALNRCRLFANTCVELDGEVNYADPLESQYGGPDYKNFVIHSAFSLAMGYFVTLEMAYEDGSDNMGDDGRYFWKIVNYGRIPPEYDDPSE